MTAEIDLVAKAHPFVLVPVWLWTAGGMYRLVEVERTDADYEDIDALPLVEQAAIFCAIHGSDRDGPTTWADLITDDGRVTYHAVLATNGIPFAFKREDIADKWAEAEARIRTGEVRP